MARRKFAISLGGLLLAAGLASAQPAAPIVPTPPCPRPEADWSIARGELASGRTCGALVLTTDAADVRFTIGGLYRHVSLARITHRRPVQVPYELAFDWVWLTPGRWTLEVHGLGTVVLLAPASIGFYVDDAQLMGAMFEDLPPARRGWARRIVVRQTAAEIAVYVDGALAGRRAVPDAAASGVVTIGFRGAPGERTRALLRSPTLRRLTSP